MMFLVDDRELPYNEVHITYKIKKGDTLQSVAQELNINSRVLRAHHNIHCRIPDLIETNFPYQLEYLILAPVQVELTDDEKEKSRKKIHLSNGVFSLSLSNPQINNTYGVLYTIENGEETTTIKQQINVKWKGRSKNNFYFFEVDRIGAVYINDTPADTMAQEMAEKAAAALYPLEVIVDKNGDWVDINNFNEIKERWQDTKKQIQKYYKGEQVEKYFSIYDRNLEDEDTLYLSLSKDWFLNIFFSGIHVEYPYSLAIQKDIDFSLMAKIEPLNYTVNQKLDDHFDIDNYIVLNINGKLDDERNKTNFERELNLPVKEYSDQKVMGDYRAKYFLNPLNHMPESIFCSCTLALDIPQKYTVTISNVNDKEEMSTKPRPELFFDEIKPKPKWWQL